MPLSSSGACEYKCEIKKCRAVRESEKQSVVRNTDLVSSCDFPPSRAFPPLHFHPTRAHKMSSKAKSDVKVLKGQDGAHCVA